MVIQILIIFFIIFVLARIIRQFKMGEITNRELFIWFVFWAVVAMAVMVPKKTDDIARLLGVARGADMLVYLSILGLFFIVFKMIVKLERIDKNITKIIRKISLDEKEKNE